MTNALKILSQGEMLNIPKTLIQAIGLEEAIVLTDIASDYEYWESRELAEDGWIYPTRQEFEERTHFTREKQKRILDRLVKRNLITVENYRFIGGGHPSKRFIKINEKELEKLFLWNKER